VTGSSTPAAVRGGDDVSAGRVFARTCAAEWTRLWTVKPTWWFLAAAVVALVGIGTVAGFEAAASADPPVDEPAWGVAEIATMPGQFALLALVAIAVTSDYATGGIVPTLQWTPRRGVLFLARTLVTVLVATMLGVLLGVCSAAAALAAGPPGITLPWDEGLDALGTIALVIGAGTALTAGLGFLLRNTAGVLVSVFLLMLVLPILLPQFGYEWLSAIAEILPGSGAAFLLLGEVPGMSQTSSVAVLLGWAGGALLLGWLRLVRDDANR
jgi:ABC-2 type transport system permease protein